ncbi:hypothetical protein COLO4_21365 [Corchorus olitorius]|uniref:Uncharacterized protein n=1 Tax=Corchorus olitorius TaxID=93759 RepID=A0A1R3ITV6_9ROSI|nr:hypothetical protein COLO4_21365 [Corchorus olitorius]
MARPKAQGTAAASMSPTCILRLALVKKRLLDIISGLLDK